MIRWIPWRLLLLPWLLVVVFYPVELVAPAAAADADVVVPVVRVEVVVVAVAVAVAAVENEGYFDFDNGYLVTAIFVVMSRLN